MVRKLVYFLVAVAFGLLTYRCSTTEPLNVVKDSGYDCQQSSRILANTDSRFAAECMTDSYKIDYVSTALSASKFKSTVSIFDVNLGKNIGKIEFEVDTSLTAYKLVQHEAVVAASQKFLSNYPKLPLSFLAMFESFGKSIANNPDVSVSSQLVQNVFFQNAIINTIVRSQGKKSDCGCTPYPAYYVKKSGFWCQEDFYISPKNIVSKMDTTGRHFTEQDKKVIQYLYDNRNLTRMSVDKLFLVTESKESYYRKLRTFYASHSGAYCTHISGA